MSALYHNFLIDYCRDFSVILHTVNDLFSAQCAKEGLVLVNILVGKSSTFSTPHHFDVFLVWKSCGYGHSLNGTDNLPVYFNAEKDK